MKYFQIFFAIGCVSLLFTACVADKRLHNAGYHVRWKSISRVSSHAEKDNLFVQKSANSAPDTLPSIAVTATERMPLLIDTSEYDQETILEIPTPKKIISSQPGTKVRKNSKPSTKNIKTRFNERKEISKDQAKQEYNAGHILYIITICLTSLLILYGIFVLITGIPFWGIALVIAGFLALMFTVFEYAPLLRFILVLCFGLLLIACGIFLLSLGSYLGGVLLITTVSILLFIFLLIAGIYTIFGQFDSLF